MYMMEPLPATSSVSVPVLRNTEPLSMFRPLLDVLAMRLLPLVFECSSVVASRR